MKSVGYTIKNFSPKLSLLSRLYTFRNPSEVSIFLKNNISVISFIKNAYNKIKEFFPFEELILDVISSYEDSNNKELMIYIHTNLSPNDAFYKLKMLDMDWWLNVSPEVNKKLCIHVEF